MVQTIDLDEERIRGILDDLDANEVTRESGREAQRYQYRIPALVMHMQQPGSSSPVPFLVPGRNISSQGLSLLHGGFVHPGTRCLMQLITSSNKWTNAGGTVVRCRFVKDNVHEVGVRLDHDIDPAVYCADAVRSRVLLAEDDPSIARLARIHLEQLNADVDVVTNGHDAVETALEGEYDLILMDIEMPVMDGLKAVEQLRSRGYVGRIVAATALTQPDHAEKCLAAGCDKFLPKPFSRAGLADLLASLSREPLFSDLHDEPSMKALVRAFVSELAGHIRRLNEAIAQEDADTVLAVARLLKAEGSSAGFDVIAEVAQGMETAVFAGTALAEIKKDADSLAKLRARVRAPKEALPPKHGPPADVMVGKDSIIAGDPPAHSGPLSEDPA